MLDFFFQLAGMGLGYVLGSGVLCAVSMRIDEVFSPTKFPGETTEKVPFLSWDPLAILALVLTGVTWPPIGQSTHQRRSTLHWIFLLLLPPLLLLVSALFGTLLLKATLFVTLWALLLESCIRVLLTLVGVYLLPLPPLPGWNLALRLLGKEPRGEIRWVFPALIFGVFALELLTKFVILDLFFGRLTDALLQYLYLVG